MFYYIFKKIYIHDFSRFFMFYSISWMIFYHILFKNHSCFINDFHKIFKIFKDFSGFLKIFHVLFMNYFWMIFFTFYKENIHVLLMIWWIFQDFQDFSRFFMNFEDFSWFFFSTFYFWSPFCHDYIMYFTILL